MSGALPVSGSDPIRTPLRGDSTGTGALEQGAEGKPGALGGLARILRRREPGAEETTAGTGRSKKKGIGPRRVRAMVTTVDPWSIMKLAFLLSIAVGIAFVVATSIVWEYLNSQGVFASINEQITTILDTESKPTFLQFTDKNKIMSVVILLSVVNTVIMTALATIGAILYNMIVKLVGGVYITLSDE
jgi:hypothetical protein